MPDGLAVIARFSTDQGAKVVCSVFTPETELRDAVRHLCGRIEKQGMFPVKLLRVYRQPVPVVDGKAVWALAGQPERVPEGTFVLRQEMLG